MSLRLLFRLSLLLWIPLFVILLFLPAGASENREESPPSVYFAPPAFEHLNCGTDHLLEHWPDEQVRRQEELEIAYQKWARERPDPVDRRAAEARFSPPPYELPIVFHILHNNGPENISDARILRSLDQLNASMANLAYYDQGTGVNTQIQFCLAQRSPENLPSNGITRQVTPLTELDADTEDITLKNLARWTTSAYVNVYVVREICGLGFGCGVAGYAYLPGAHGGPADGIVIEARWLGNGEANNSVLTHEVGHYLGLQHTFRGGCTNDDCLADGDLVCDTPPDNSTSPVPCSGSVNTCTTDTDSGFATDQPDMFINYMDYGFFNCYSAFTAGQSGRMSFFIDNTRASLLNSFGCQPPCPAPVIASLTGAPSGELLVGDAVNLISTSTGATSLNWFVNGNLEFSGPNFNFTFTAPGTYTITLVAASASPALCAADEQTITVEVVCPYTPDITSADQFPVEFTTVNYSTTADAPFYEWTVDGAVVSNQASVDYFFPGSGIYELCLRKGMGSCEQTACRTIFVTNVYQPCTGQTFAQNITVQLDEDDLGFQPFYSAIELDGADLALAGANSNAIYFAKVTAIGQPIWSRRIVFDDIFVPSGVTQQVENFHFYIDNAGNYLFFGSYGPELNGKNILVKYDPTNDQLVFARSFHLPTHFALHIDQQPGSSDYFLINRQTNTAATNWQLEFFTVDGNTGDFTGSNINQSWALPGTRALFTRDAQWYNGRLYTTSTMGTNNTVETGDATSVQAFDANGQLIWSRVMFEGLNGQRNLFADRLWVDEDGILSVSRQRDINGVASVQFFNKLDLNGAVEWQRAFFINQNERIVSVKRFQGGYLALLNFGATASPAASSIGLMLIDAQGDLIWSASYGDDYSPQFENSQHLLTAGEFIFLVGGRSTSSATTPTDNQSFLYRLNNAGSFQDECSTVEHLLIIPLNTQRPWQSIGLQSSNTSISAANDNFTLAPVNNQVNNTCNSPCFEICDNGIDDDFNGETDCEDAALANTCCCLSGPAPPALPADTSLCPGDSLLVAVSTLVGGSFSWSNGATDSVLVINTRGTYTLTIVDSCGRDTSASFTVTILPPTVPPDLGPDLTVCDNGVTTLDAGPGWESILWFDFTDARTATAFGAGDFWLRVTDSCGQVYTDTIAVTVEAATELDLGPADSSIVCGTDSITLSAPLGYDEYNWLPAGTLSCNDCPIVRVAVPPQGDSLTIFALGTTDNGCAAGDSIRIFSVPTPGQNITDSFCFETAYVFGDTSFTETGQYFLTDDCGTTDTLNLIELPQPPTLTAEISLCAGDSTLINGRWYRAPAVVTDTFTTTKGCDSLFVTNLTLFTPMTSPPELGADTVLCPGEVLRLDAGSGWDSIRWADGTSGMTTSTEIAGAFWLRVVDSCGIVFTDTLNVLIDSVPEINLGTADSSVVCGTDSITLTAPMGFVEYRWLPSESLSCNDCVNVRVAVPPPGDSITVSVVGITENDCAGGDSIRIFSTPALGQNISDSFCFETAYVFGDTSFTETGQYLLTDDCGTTDTLNLIELPQPPTLTAEVSLCAGDSTLINGRWYRAPAVVTDTFTTARGCDSLFVTNLALFTPATSPPELGTDTVLCPGDVLRLDAGSGWNSIRWADGTSGMTTSTEIAGAFWLRVVDSCGIVFTDTLNVLIGSVPEIDLGPADSSVVCGTDSITLTAPMGFAEYRWLPAGSLSCNDCPSVSVAVPPPGDSITVSVVGIT
ncbi:MAG: M43 family zinc metalloprotease, partial [Bacteroidota bacterium]